MQKDTKILKTIFKDDEVEIHYTQLVGENSRANMRRTFDRSQYFWITGYDSTKMVDYLNKHG